MSQDEPIIYKTDDGLVILEEGEFCCVCRGVESLSRIAMGDPADPLKYTVCDPCFSSERFHDYVANEFEKMFVSQPDRWRKNPNGTWSAIGNDL